MLYMALLFLTSGCAIRSSVVLLEAEQQYHLAEAYKKDAPYAWYMADQYIKKAREEYATSRLKDANFLAKEAEKWALKVQKKAQTKEAEQ